MRYHAVTAILLVAAITCSRLGYATPGLALLVAGGALELWYWLRILWASDSGQVPTASH